MAAAFSSDGRRAVTASMDKSPRVWDVESGKCLVLLAGHSRGVDTLAISPDGRDVLTAGDDRTVRLWGMP